ncbi:hypothetical protein ALC56_11004 [Trachymyrmex septentrionalis]|uniref:Uncharacterized protein n=1 Tax=Trachymyrmex septentrionalis TaxID=34720 RepID=A0A195F2W2_9HYME|nr:hypothetical protein ALC56_11004 [Trachymyrmex septentrionalis]
MYRDEPAIDRAGGGGGNRSAGDPRRARSPRRRRASAAADLPEDADGEEEPYGKEEEEEEEAYVVLDVQPRQSYGDSTTRVCCNDDSCCCRAAQKRPGRRRREIRGSGNALRILYVVAAAAFLALAVSPDLVKRSLPMLDVTVASVLSYSREKAINSPTSVEEGGSLNFYEKVNTLDAHNSLDGEAAKEISPTPLSGRHQNYVNYSLELYAACMPIGLMGVFSINDTNFRGRGNCSRRSASRVMKLRARKPSHKRRHCLEGFSGWHDVVRCCLHPLIRPFRGIAVLGSTYLIPHLAALICLGFDSLVRFNSKK